MSVQESRSAGPPRHRIHVSLIQPVLFAGVEYPVAILEATLVLALLVGVGLHLATIALSAVILGIVHPTMTRLTARDPHLSRAYLRSVRYADHYVPSVTIQSRHAPVRSSISSIR